MNTQDMPHDLPAKYVCPGCRDVCPTDEALQAPIRRIEPRDPYYGTARTQLVCPACAANRNAQGYVTAAFRYGGTQGARDSYADLDTGYAAKDGTTITYSAIKRGLADIDDPRGPVPSHDGEQKRVPFHPPADPEATAHARAVAAERVKERQALEAQHAASVAAIAQAVKNNIAQEIAARTICMTATDDELKTTDMSDMRSRLPTPTDQDERTLVLLPDYTLAYSDGHASDA